MANTTILQKKSSNTTILQEQVEPPCHAKTITLYVMFRANNTEITIKNCLMTVMSGNC